MIGLLLACATGGGQAPAPATEPLPTDMHRAAQAAAESRVTDPARGGPPLVGTAAPLPPFTGVDRATATYVGSGVCAGCHPSAANVWRGTAHAHALETLAAASKAYDPGCLRCHTVGIGHPGGFGPERTSDDFAAVGCESCHGPGSDHASAPLPAYGELPAGPSACVACHTHDNSPEFRFEGYWDAIAHGR